jgi:hypothetical protein
VFDNRWTFQRGSVHLGFELGGKRIGYAYIRKNGSSAFKRALGYPSGTDIRVIEPTHRWGSRQRYDATIFVWRDPEERLKSLYRNKILEREEAEDIIARYRTTMGEEPDGFESFVEFATTNADPHCVPQRDHLKPLVYTHAIPLSSLHESMVRLVGVDAARTFARPINASSETALDVSDRARALIRKHYARDYEMIAQITGRRT